MTDRCESIWGNAPSSFGLSKDAAAQHARWIETNWAMSNAFTAPPKQRWPKTDPTRQMDDKAARLLCSGGSLVPPAQHGRGQ